MSKKVRPQGPSLSTPQGVEGANFEVLKQISVREPVKLKGLRFRDLFKWLSDSQKAVSRSTPGDTIPLPTPTGPSGWAEV
jgi:uncharacterized protein YegL